MPSRRVCRIRVRKLANTAPPQAAALPARSEKLPAVLTIPKGQWHSRRVFVYLFLAPEIPEAKSRIQAIRCGALCGRLVRDKSGTFWTRRKTGRRGRRGGGARGRGVGGGGGGRERRRRGGGGAKEDKKIVRDITRNRYQPRKPPKRLIGEILSTRSTCVAATATWSGRFIGFFASLRPGVPAPQARTRWKNWLLARQASLQGDQRVF
jgi:hypothetical protein